jgi:hypothetical protein
MRSLSGAHRVVGFRDCDPGGTAIRASVVERDSDRRLVAYEPEIEVEASNFVAALAAIAIAAAALVLAVSPAVIAMRLVDLPVGWVGTGLGCLGAAVGGVKLIAMAWAVGGRLPAVRPASATVAIAD